MKHKYSFRTRYTTPPCAIAASGQQHGFTLLEILISLFVLSIGLLGIAGMQLGGMQATKSAFIRTQATLAAYDIVDRMRTNPDALSAGAYDNIDSTSLPTRPDCIYTSLGCSSAGLAIEDLYEWSETSIALLPSATGTVVKDVDVYNIAVNWAEASDATNPNKSIVIKMRF